MQRINMIAQNKKAEQKELNERLSKMNNEVARKKQEHNQELFNKFCKETVPLIRTLFPLYGALKSIRWAQSRTTTVGIGNTTTDAISLDEIGVWLNEYLNSDNDSYLLNRKIYSISELKEIHKSLHKTLWNLTGLFIQNKEMLFAFGSNIMFEFFADKIQITNFDTQKTENLTYK